MVHIDPELRGEYTLNEEPLLEDVTKTLIAKGVGSLVVYDQFLILTTGALLGLGSYKKEGDTAFASFQANDHFTFFCLLDQKLVDSFL